MPSRASENQAWPGRREREGQRPSRDRGRRQAPVCSRADGAGPTGRTQSPANICKGTHKAIAAFKAQNGKRHEFEPVVKAQCAKGKKKGGGKK